MKWCVEFPEESILIVRPCLKRICLDNKPASKLLSVLLYRYSIRKEAREDAENLNEVKVASGQTADQDMTFDIYRKQSQLVADMIDEIDEKTLHDVAIPTLQMLGYLDIEERPGVTRYIVHLDRVIAALAAYKQGPQALEAFLRERPQLEKFLIAVQLEKFLINKKNFLLQLEIIRIGNRNISHCKRGRKPSSRAAREGDSEKPQITKIITEIRNRDSSDSAIAPSLRTHPPSQEEQTHNQQPRAEQTPSRHSSLTDEVPPIGSPPLVPDNHQSAETAPASEASAPPVPATETAPPTPAKAKAEKPQRKPSAARGKQSAEVQARINAILDCMDATMQKLINTPSFQFSRTKAAKTLIFETLIEGRAPGQEVTPRMLGRVMSKMYSIPKDSRSGFCWKDNMSVSAICHNFDKMWLLVCADDAARTPVQDELDEVEQRRKAEREEKRRQFWEKKEREAAEWERKRQDEAIERAARKAERAAAYTPPPSVASVVPIVAKGAH